MADAANARLLASPLAKQAAVLQTRRVKILLIKGTRGALGCGYINLAAAEKFGHALAIVSGVADYNEMLAAEVKAVSSAAAELGITPGMTGKEALEKLA